MRTLIIQIITGAVVALPLYYAAIYFGADETWGAGIGAGISGLIGIRLGEWIAKRWK